MGGGYVSCGAFSGEDKSCSAFQGVIEQVETLPCFAPSGEFGQFFSRVKAFLSGQPDPEWTDYLLITPQQAAEFAPYLEDCKQGLIADLGTSDPFDAIEKDAAVSGLDETEAKWGKGKGWRLYCVTDLLRAVEHSKATGEDICVSFD